MKTKEPNKIAGCSGARVNEISKKEENKYEKLVLF